MRSSTFTKRNHCPRCGAARVHRSRRRTKIERVLSVFGARFRRCHGCDLRTIQLGPLSVRVNWLERLKRHASIGVVLALATIVIVIAILWFGRLKLAASEALLLLPVR